LNATLTFHGGPHDIGHEGAAAKKKNMGLNIAA